MIRLNDPHSVGLISAACKVPFDRRYHKCIARYGADDQLMGGVLFTDYNVVSMQIHVASFKANWINRQLLWLTFDYPFNVCRVEKLLGLVPSANQKALDLDRHLGFKEETRVKDVFPDGDMVVLGMYRADCRFLKMKPVPLGDHNGKVHAAA